MDAPMQFSLALKTQALPVLGVPFVALPRLFMFLQYLHTQQSVREPPRQC